MVKSKAYRMARRAYAQGYNAGADKIAQQCSAAMQKDRARHESANSRIRKHKRNSDDAVQKYYRAWRKAELACGVIQEK